MTLSRDVMIQALQRHSPAFDGLVYVAVRTTGIVCRTVCPARPMAKNVTFFASLGAARRAGYRPCKRCKPERRRSGGEWTASLLARLVPATPKRSGTPLAAARITTPLGAMLGVASDDGLVLLEFADRPMLATQLTRIGRLFTAPIEPGTNAHLASVQRELDEWFAGHRRRFETPVVTRGTPFQESAWRALLGIPYGETVSYQAQASVLGKPGAGRAVGRANGDNRLAIVIPCHRVRRAEGTLGGYGGGVWRKRMLLDLEARYGCTLTRSSVNTM